MMRFMFPGEGDLNDPLPGSVCWVFFTFMSGHPLTGRLGRKGCLKHSDKSLILHRILSLSSLLKCLGVEWSQMRKRLAACRVGWGWRCGTTLQSQTLLNQEHPHPLPVFHNNPHAHFHGTLNHSCKFKREPLETNQPLRGENSKTHFIWQPVL